MLQCSLGMILVFKRFLFNVSIRDGVTLKNVSKIRNIHFFFNLPSKLCNSKTSMVKVNSNDRELLLHGSLKGICYGNL